MADSYRIVEFNHAAIEKAGGRLEGTDSGFNLLVPERAIASPTFKKLEDVLRGDLEFTGKEFEEALIAISDIQIEGWIKEVILKR